MPKAKPKAKIIFDDAEDEDEEPPKSAVPKAKPKIIFDDAEEDEEPPKSAVPKAKPKAKIIFDDAEDEDEEPPKSAVPKAKAKTSEETNIEIEDEPQSKKTKKSVPCTHVYTKANAKNEKKAGEVCGRDSTDGLCASHRSNLKRKERAATVKASKDDEAPKKSKAPEVCSYQMRKGPRSGSQCGKPCSGENKYCSIHHKSESPDANVEKYKMGPTVFAPPHSQMFARKIESKEGTVFFFDKTARKGDQGSIVGYLEKDRVLALTDGQIDYLNERNILIKDEHVELKDETVYVFNREAQEELDRKYNVALEPGFSTSEEEDDDKVTRRRDMKGFDIEEEEEEDRFHDSD